MNQVGHGLKRFGLVSLGCLGLFLLGCRSVGPTSPGQGPPPIPDPPPMPDPGTVSPPGTGEQPPGPGSDPDPATPPASGPGWVVLFEENFETLADFATPTWERDTYPDDGPFSDDGQFFRERGISPPVAYRISRPFGKDGWLTLESYTRDPQTALNDLASLGPDPSGQPNRVLRIRSPRHTDATLVRPTVALPARYRVTVRVGYADWGDGLGGNNGYDGDEQAGPWRPGSATTDNGYYWLAILDAMPRPHNNVYIHHHRKVVVDSDNHYPPWTEIWDGQSFVTSGQHPIMMFALDGSGATDPWIGKPFISYSAGQWQPSGKIRAVDAYKDRTWYTVTITRDLDRFILEISGDFAHGGSRTVRGELLLADACIWHYNRPGESARSQCLDGQSLPDLPGFPLWPSGQGWPDYFLFGDPHANYYEGQVHYDDVKLEVWKE